MQDTIKQYDVVIVGGGLIGMALAAGLAKSPLSILLLEQNTVAAIAANILDLRTTGLARSSATIFQQMGLWEKIEPLVTAIEKLDISEQGGYGSARIDAREFEMAPVGYMAPNLDLIKVLSDHVQGLQNVSIQTPASLVALEKNAQGYLLQCQAAETELQVQAKLVVGADGARSKLRSLLGIESQHKEYGQSAIISNVQPEKEHQNCAYERFTEHGPLAILPIQEQHCALIWTHSSEQAAAHMALDDDAFLEALEQAFGRRLGRLKAVGKRVSYPLSMTHANTLTAPAAVLVGNAAQSVHPVAAQGFNLGLRDAQSLLVLLQKQNYQLEQLDELLKTYADSRVADREHVIKLTDGLTRMFATQFPAARALRGIGLRVLGALAPLQRVLLNRNSGMRYLNHWFDQ
ncbi:MAG: UbiH/UbiF/VisC/COQ6 family ubiquinone biosynthesis hydroxylase [Gammaproteobacteria bacterium]|nr:UbiH/UbiF/VisC/COQ6 family ubiquinone biosynthesis hydroxylase [Gammaproteobacteria bacterium]